MRFLKNIICVLVVLLSWVNVFAQWTLKTPAPTARWGATSCSLNGYVYLISGNGSNANERFDPSTNSWTVLAPIPTIRAYAASVGAPNGKIYVFGGAAGSTWLTTVEEYDPITNTWATKAPMSVGRMGLGAAVYGNEIFVTGGWTGALSNLNQAYNYITNTWTTYANLPTARYQVGSAEVGGLIYVVGGYVSATSNLVDAYNPLTNTWTSCAPLNTSRYLHGVAAVNGQIWATAGYGSGSLALTEYYSPATNSWTNFSNLNVARYRTSAAATSNCIYAVAGFNGSASLNSIEEYCPIPLPVGMSKFEAVQQGGDNIILWETESEINNDYFQLEKSNDALTWELLEIVDGFGNSNTLKSYSVIDTRPFETTYYRNRQVDLNGDETVYGPIAVSRSIAKNERCTVHPNPGNGYFILESEGSHILLVEVKDAMGQTIMRIEPPFPTPIFDVNMIGYESGVYYFTIHFKDSFDSQKVIIL